MVKVLDEGVDLSECEVKECTASGAIHDYRMVEVTRGDKKLAVQVADWRSATTRPGGITPIGTSST